MFQSWHFSSILSVRTTILWAFKKSIHEGDHIQANGTSAGRGIFKPFSCDHSAVQINKFYTESCLAYWDWKTVSWNVTNKNVATLYAKYVILDYTTE